MDTKNKKMDITLLTNSDVGIGHTVGFRATHISKLLYEKKELREIICRDYIDIDVPKKYFRTIYPPNGRIGKILPQFFTWLGIKNKKIQPQCRRIQIKLFTFFTPKIQSKLLHTWEYAPLVSEKARKNGTIIIQDFPIAINTIQKHYHKQDPDYPIPIPDQDAINAAKSADYIICPSPFVKDSLRNEGISSKNISVIPFGVDTSKYKPSKTKHDKFTVAFSGNITVRKGVKYLIQAWKELNLKNAQLILYGGIQSDATKYLKDQEKYNIITPGFTNISKVLPKAHVYAFPSCLEGSSKSVYEAMACGLPVITTYNAGSIIRDGKDGFIVPVQSVEKIKEKIMYLYEQKSEREKMGKSGQEYVQTFTWESYAKKIYEVQKQVWLTFQK